jgi:hypothetical protein
MNEQFYTPKVVERSDHEPTDPVVNMDPLTGNDPVEAGLFEETPLDETAAVISPVVDDELSVVYEAPKAETEPQAAPFGANAGSSAALLNHEESEHFRTRWNEIQGMFVDEPRSAVQQADKLVSEVIEQIAQMFTNEHTLLEDQWNQSNDVSTEDLRKTLQRYRTFFNRLVM